MPAQWNIPIAQRLKIGPLGFALKPKPENSRMICSPTRLYFHITFSWFRLSNKNVHTIITQLFELLLRDCVTNLFINFSIIALGWNESFIMWKEGEEEVTRRTSPPFNRPSVACAADHIFECWMKFERENGTYFLQPKFEIQFLLKFQFLYWIFNDKKKFKTQYIMHFRSKSYEVTSHETFHMKCFPTMSRACLNFLENFVLTLAGSWDPNLNWQLLARWNQD